MYRRRVGLTARQLYTEYVQLPVIGWFALALVLFFAIGAAAFGLHSLTQSEDRSSDATTQSHLVALFGGTFQGNSISWPETQAAVDYRATVAENLLYESSDADSDVLAPFLARSDLEQIADTGNPPNLTNPQIVANVGAYLNWTVSWTLPCAGFMLIGLALISYCVESIANGEQLIDLPWSKWWVYPFVVATLPFGWPLYGCSFVRGRVLRYLSPAAEVRLADLAATLPSHLRPDQSVAEARQAYLQLRGIRFLASRQSDITELEREIDRGTDELDRIENRSEVLQRKLPVWRRDLAEAEDALASVDASLLSPEAHAAEFDRLLELPGVVGIDVGKMSVKLFCGPVIVQLSGRYFDLGDYIITIRPGKSQVPELQCARNASTERYGHFYREGEGFCFGDRNNLLEPLVTAGDIGAVASLVVESLFFINPQDEAKVMKLYPEVKP